ncbi:MAG: RHS repeat-associated core domain-containing protein [Bacteroidia bacterium]
MGNRIVKIVKSGENEDEWQYTYYARDASGQTMAVYEKTYIDPEYLSDPGWPEVEWLPEGASHITLFRSAEYHLYGSSRLGIHLYVDTLKAQVFRTGEGEGLFTDTGYWSDTMNLTPALPIPYQTPPEDGTYFYTLTRGEKRYELSNHLGNVLSTVSDRKLQLTTDEETVSGYTADVWGMNDYYAFGMLMPGRNQRRGGYRFGFNGMEQDNEAKGVGNSLDFGARVYDSRLGKFLSRDPQENNFPHQSTYSAFNLNPIYNVDPSGESGVGYLKKWRRKFIIKSTLYFSGEGATTELAKETANSVEMAWNEAKGSIEINGKNYLVQFKVNGKSISKEISLAKIQQDEAIYEEMGIRTKKGMKTLENNYVLLDNNYDPFTQAQYDPFLRGGNLYYNNASRLKHSMKHEYGHGLGWYDASQISPMEERLLNPDDPQILHEYGLVKLDEYLNGYHDVLGYQINGSRAPGIMTGTMSIEDQKRLAGYLGGIPFSDIYVDSENEVTNGKVIPADILKLYFNPRSIRNGRTNVGWFSPSYEGFKNRLKEGGN